MIKIYLFWECVKKNWKIACLTLWTITVWFFSRRSSQAAIEAMEANKKSYEARIKSLKEQHKIEIKKREELNLKYQETLVKIEKKYNKKEKELTRKQKEEVRNIVKNAKSNPNEINEKIENLFGFVSDN